jgi:hypothetical protein
VAIGYRCRGGFSRLWATPLQARSRFEWLCWGARSQGPNAFATTVCSSGASSTIANNAVSTSIIAVNGALLTPTQLKPGDLVTIKLRYDLVTGDYENFALKSFLPLPVLFTNDSDANGTPGDAWNSGGTWNGTAGDLPVVGVWKLGADHSAGLTSPSVSADGTANSLTFDFGNHTNVGNDPKVIEVIYSLKVSDQPFADQLFLTLLAESSQKDTVTSTPVTMTSNALINIELAEPEVTIKTGVVQVSNSGAGITGTTGTWVATTDTTSVPFSTTIATASAVDGNLTNFDGGDTLRLATAIENTGGAAAVRSRRISQVP